MTNGYRALRNEYSTDGDPWGTALDWLFSIAEVLHHSFGWTPAHWQFTDSPLHDDTWRDDIGYPESVIAEMVEDKTVTEQDLVKFGNVLARYTAILRNAGKDY